MARPPPSASEEEAVNQVNKYEFMSLLIFAFFAVATALAFALRDDGRSRRIYTQHDQWWPEPEQRLDPAPKRAALPPAQPLVIEATTVKRRELER